MNMRICSRHLATESFEFARRTGCILPNLEQLTEQLSPDPCPKKSEYGLRALLELCETYGAACSSAMRLPSGRRIPVEIFSSKFCSLKRAGLLARRGIRGRIFADQIAGRNRWAKSSGFWMARSRAN